MNKNIFKQIRIDAGLSQSEYAEVLGLTQAYVSMLENGVHAVSDKTKRTVIKEIGVSDDIMRQLDTLRKIDERSNKEFDYEKVGRIRKMFDEAVASNLVVYEDAGMLTGIKNTDGIPESILELVEKEITSKLDATISDIIGNVVDEYVGYIDKLTDKEAKK